MLILNLLLIYIFLVEYIVGKIDPRREYWLETLTFIHSFSLIADRIELPKQYLLNCILQLISKNINF
jgi:hypothetical protein